MAKFIVTREAESDIDEILTYISEDDFEAALNLYDRFLDLFRIIADNPAAGRERTELQAGLRCFPYRNYLIFYRRWAGIVAITRVVHGARDVDELLG